MFSRASGDMLVMWDTWKDTKLDSINRAYPFSKIKNKQAYGRVL